MGEAEKLEATALWNEGEGLLLESCHFSRRPKGGACLHCEILMATVGRLVFLAIDVCGRKGLSFALFVFSVVSSHSRTSSIGEVSLLLRSHVEAWPKQSDAWIRQFVNAHASFYGNSLNYSYTFFLKVDLGFLRSVLVLPSELYFDCTRWCFQRSKSKQQLVNFG